MPPTPPATPPATPPSGAAAPTAPAEVFLITGVAPEVGAYAMAKYSRSALSMRESLREIDNQKAEKFLNTFYFQYGHRSIADLAHLSFAIERLSILAAIEVADETRWDGQERSTRYQEFRRTGYTTPPELPPAAAAGYATLLDGLFAFYEGATARLAAFLETRIPRPETLKPETYQRTLRARAFDVSRYLLPLATCTSLGQIVSARTLEQQICRLLSSEVPECRTLGEQLRQAASAPGAAPTLVKYTAANPYVMQTRQQLRALAAQELAAIPPDSTPGVALAPRLPLEIEVAASLLYPHCDHSYAQICAWASGLTAARRNEIVDLGFAHRGGHDELLREFHAGHAFQFDILMDIGGFRDLHRHRRCVQLHQGYTARHGFDTPELWAECGEASAYTAQMEAAGAWSTQLGARGPATTAAYALPLGFRKRTLFKMDLAEVAYIAELRTAPAGHFSYRDAAWRMFEELRRQHPELCRHLRVTDPRQPSDPLQR